MAAASFFTLDQSLTRLYRNTVGNETSKNHLLPIIPTWEIFHLIHWTRMLFLTVSAETRKSGLIIFISVLQTTKLDAAAAAAAGNRSFMPLDPLKL